MNRYFILILVFLNLSSSEGLSDDGDDSGYLRGVEYLDEIENTELNNICEGFRCKDGICISSNLTCNGIPDCPDHSDEDPCRELNITCEGFRCNDNNCISSNLTCNGISDCPDSSDEVSCPDKSSLPEKVRPCQGNDFHCSNGRCILASWKCDDRDDCGDNSDELDCPLPKICTQDQYRCDDGKCISKLWRCDGESDCSNGSDENDCHSTSCVPDKEIRCGNGQCVPIHWACDGTNDCSDGADEKMCSVKKICDVTKFKCDNGLCINKTFVCDQKQDCTDGSDEKNCSSVKKVCDLTEFKCDDGLCINKTFVCDQKQDCTDGLDENNCSKTCKEGFYQCNDGATCIYTHELCDGHKDCPDGDDEVNCAARCNPEEYYFCTYNSRCISKRWICDGDNDCGDAADEMPEICNRHIIHAKRLDCKEFFCNVSAECVSWSKVCDGQNDCKDSTDETGMCSIACADDGACSQVCQKTPLGSKCSCYKGYTLSPDGYTCEDINECDIPGSCSQFCNNTKGSFECYCAEGYVLDNEKICKANGGPATLLYILPDEIKGIDLSSHLKRLYVNETSGDIRGFDYDASQGVLFWSDWRKSTINSYTLSNNTREVLLTSEKIPERLRWDWIHENFYFTADGGILVCSKNGEFCSTVVPAAAAIISSLDISPNKGFMFLSVWSGKPLQNKGIIERTVLDGSNRKVIIDEGLTWPSAVTVDHVMEMIYWTDVGLNVMESADFHGLKRRVVVSNDMYYPFSMAVFEDSVFWSDWGTDSIIRCDKFSGKNCTYFHKGHVKSEVLAIVHKGHQPKGENRCLNHDCPQLCLPTRTSFVCKCDDDYNLVNGTCETKTEMKPGDWLGGLGGLDEEAISAIEQALNI